MKSRMELLEQAILEMGSEIFKLKHTIVRITEENEKLTNFANKLKKILRDKNIVDEDTQAQMSTEEVLAFAHNEHSNPNINIEELKKLVH